MTCFYDPATAILRVVVSQCRNLPHFGRYRPNPYVKLLLSGEPGHDRVFHQKTTTRYTAVDPLYGESLMVGWHSGNFKILSVHRLVEVFLGAEKVDDIRVA